MTDEYFFIEEISPNSSEIESEKSNGDKKTLKVMQGGDNNYPATDKKSQEIRLHEIEHQLEMAESRCNTLKGQVDYMKMLYNGMNTTEKDNKPAKTNIKLPNTSPTRRLTIDNGKKKKNDNESSSIQLREAIYPEEPPSRDIDQQPYLERGERQICEKNASAAVKSINNIISGITNSVNRLTQLQVQIGNSSTTNNIDTTDPVGIQNIKCTPRYVDQIAAAEKPYQSESNNQTEIKHSTESIKSKSNKKKRRAKSVSKQSVTSTGDTKKKLKVTAKHIEKRTRLINPQPAGDVSQSSVSRLRKRQYGKLKNIASRTVLIKRSLNAYGSSKPSIKNGKQEWKSDKLIELYHNSAVKIITASEDSLHTKKVSKPEIAKLRPPPPPPLPEQEQITMQAVDKLESIQNIPCTQQQFRPQLSTINEGEIQYGGSYYQKNYELPTIAHKMKQVAKSYYQNFSFRTIPFVAAKSITPSHNLGVNIQQVLSIIKGRKPLSGISPTLAYNIELAANKLGSRPLSALVSNLGSRLNNNRYVCPVAKKYPFSHLQELAKEIPEETIEEMNAIYEEDGQKAPHMMAAGDKDVENPEKCWFTEKKSEEKCTCVPKQGVSFNDVYTKYTEEKVPLSMKRARRRPWNENRKIKNISSLETYSNQVSSTRCNQINKRERSLKEVLGNLHEEFSTLNELYEELKAEVGNGKSDSATLILEIERMEKDLQNKEDEITMVMSLYKEVMALKQQVRNLKTRAGQSTVVVSPFINRNREYKDMNAAGHLTKLLRHIQQFQETLKNKTR